MPLRPQTKPTISMKCCRPLLRGLMVQRTIPLSQTLIHWSLPLRGPRSVSSTQPSLCEGHTTLRRSPHYPWPPPLLVLFVALLLLHTYLPIVLMPHCTTKLLVAPTKRHSVQRCTVCHTTVTAARVNTTHGSTVTKLCIHVTQQQHSAHTNDALRHTALYRLLLIILSWTVPTDS